MEQPDFGEGNRYVRLDDKKDPLVKLNAIIPWELFRPRLRSVWREPQRERKSSAGRKPWDEIVMLKTDDSVRSLQSIFHQVPES
ncbi:MAG: hypothetical protein F4X32_03030 [Candidatus Dadabacteria bacterium]|nr:hypothetical protein [Candidatus Dadabacteria bacterium]